ncbi:MAG: transposase family protein, partial [Rhodospirillaceae bacterium]
MKAAIFGTGLFNADIGVLTAAQGPAKKGDSPDGFCVNLWRATIMEGCPMSSTLLSIFSEVSDPRRGQGKMYPLAPILLFTVLAMLA